MNYLNLLINSARQTPTNKFTWLYICAALTGQILPILLKSTIGSNLNGFIWLSTTILSIILLSGLVYSVSQKESHNINISIPEGWRRGLSKIIQVGLLNILFFALLIIFFSIFWILLKLRAPFTTLIISIFFRPIFAFGMCAVIINNGSIGASAWTSILMFLKNIRQTIAISLLFIVIEQLLLGLIVLFIFISPYNELLSSSSGELLSYFKILEMPQIIFTSQVLSLIMYPWITITFTHTYSRFINEFPYSVLTPSQEAAA